MKEGLKRRLTAFLRREKALAYPNGTLFAICSVKKESRINQHNQEFSESWFSYINKYPGPGLIIKLRTKLNFEPFALETCGAIWGSLLLSWFRAFWGCRTDTFVQR